MQIEEEKLKILQDAGFTEIAIRKIGKFNGILFFLPTSNTGFAVIVKDDNGDIADIDKFGNFTWI